MAYTDQERMLLLPHVRNKPVGHADADAYYKTIERFVHEGKQMRYFKEQYEKEMALLDERIKQWDETPDHNGEIFPQVALLEAQTRTVGELLDKAGQTIDAFSQNIEQPRPRGRRPVSEYDEIYRKFIKENSDYAGAIRELERQGASREAAEEAMKRRIRKERNSETRERNSNT
jgi:hypothetical protein